MVYKRGRIYHYDFVFNGKRYFGSTRLKNEQKALQVEAKLRTDLAMGEFDLVAPKSAPTLQKFLKGDFLEKVRLKSKAKPKTVKFYENAVARLLEWDEWTNARINHIDEKMISDFVQWRAKTKRRRHGEGIVGVITINRQLAGLRHALKLALEWKYLVKMPKIRLLPGERKRDYVLTGDTEANYLTVCPPPLKEAAILMLDMGLRPDECLAIKRADLSATSLFVPAGKTANARRTVPIPQRSRETIRFLCEFWKDKEFIFPGRRKNRHLTVWALEQFHRRIRTETIDEKGARVFPPEFVIYSLRHTFGTRLAESGADASAIQKLMGHSSIRISERYIHVSGDYIERAMARKEAFDISLREKGPAKITTVDLDPAGTDRKSMK